jgi:hypothetical protein
MFPMHVSRHICLCVLLGGLSASACTCPRGNTAGVGQGCRVVQSEPSSVSFPLCSVFWCFIGNAHEGSGHEGSGRAVCDADLQQVSSIGSATASGKDARATPKPLDAVPSVAGRR